MRERDEQKPGDSQTSYWRIVFDYISNACAWLAMLNLVCIVVLQLTGHVRKIRSIYPIHYVIAVIVLFNLTTKRGDEMTRYLLLLLKAFFCSLVLFTVALVAENIGLALRI